MFTLLDNARYILFLLSLRRDSRMGHIRDSIYKGTQRDTLSLFARRNFGLSKISSNSNSKHTLMSSSVCHTYLSCFSVKYP